MSDRARQVRVASVEESGEVARLLHDFNTEFETPSPGIAELATRLRHLLSGDDTFAVLAGVPAVAVGLVTMRRNVWFTGPVALLDDLYVETGSRGRGIGSEVIDLIVRTCRERGVALIEINVDEGDVDAQRFYLRHGFDWTVPDTGEKAYYFHMELD